MKRLAVERWRPRVGDAPNAQTITVGTYGSWFYEGGKAWKAVDIVCPYCRDTMQTRVGVRRTVRYIGQLSPTEFESVVVPDSYQVVACVPCDARFVVPKNAAEWPVRRGTGTPVPAPRERKAQCD